MIAVLPLDNLGGGPGDDFFADGLTEDLITALARFTNLFVIACNSTARYRGSPVDVREVRRDLGADFVLEGGVRLAARSGRPGPPPGAAREGRSGEAVTML